MTAARSLEQRIDALSPEKRAVFEHLTAGAAAAGRFADAIVPRSPGNAAPLSFAQQRLWFLDQLLPDTTLFNLSLAVPLDETVDETVLRRSIDEIVLRHESLRTVFKAVNGEPFQEIVPELRVPLRSVDLRHVPEVSREELVLREIEEDADRPFDLETGPLLRTALLRTGDADGVFVLVMHHIVSDAWSLDVFWNELSTIWDSFARGEPSQLPELPVQYADFAVWERERLSGAVLEELLAYWRDRLAGAPALELPADHRRPPAPSGRGAAHYVTVPKPVVVRLHDLARSERATIFMVLVAAFQTLLHRYTGEEDVVVGTFTANRDRAEVEGLIGFFVNTLALRADLSERPTFRALLRQVRLTALDAYAHQDLPFARLIQELAPERDLSRNPLFQVAFQLLNTPGDESTDDLLDTKRTTSVLDLTCTTWECAEGLGVELEYSTDLFDAETVELFAGHFATLLASIADDPERRVDELPLADELAERTLVDASNRTARPFPEETLVALFEEHVARTPTAIAVRCGDREDTFDGLNRRANRIARRLRAHGVGEEQTVGICMARSAELVAALLGVLKAGGAYVPLDPSYPRERLRHILDDAGVAVVIAEAATIAALPETRVPVLDVCEAADDPSTADGDLGLRSTPDALAYVIYTSGSTGLPKGVAVGHRQILNRLHWMWEAYPFADGEVSCQKTALGFVDSIWELLGPLLRGVPSVIVPDDVARDPARLAQVLAEERVTRLWLVPTLLRTFLETHDDLEERLPALTFWVVSGEPLPFELAERFADAAPHATLYNLYGTSEVWDATWYDPYRDGPVRSRVPIGVPIANMEAYVVDDLLRPVPTGVPGELCIGGIGLGRGYLGSPSLTARRFVPDPFATAPGRRLYRTGDVVRRRADGLLEFLGRADQQLKLRGFRIEPAEIEAALARHEDVREAVVGVHADGLGEPKLVAYVVPPWRTQRGGELTSTALRQFLRRSLPEYMVPSEVVVLGALPLTATGKTDRRALPAPSGVRALAGTTYVAPRNDVEQTISSTWCELLGVDAVGVNDSFFDLGGHSLLGIRVLSRIRSALGVDLPLRTIFETSTVAGLAQVVADAQANGAPSQTLAIRPLSRDEHAAVLVLDEPPPRAPQR